MAEQFTTFHAGFTNSRYLEWVENKEFRLYTVNIGMMANQTYNTSVFNETNIVNLPHPDGIDMTNSICVLGIGTGGGTVDSASRYGVSYLVCDTPIMLCTDSGGLVAYAELGHKITRYHTQLNANLTMYDNWGWETPQSVVDSSGFDTQVQCERIILYSLRNQSCWCNYKLMTTDASKLFPDGVHWDVVYRYVNHPEVWVNINYEWDEQFPDVKIEAIQCVHIDILNNKNNEFIYTKQGDNKRIIQFQFTKDGKVLDMNQSTAVFSLKKPDGTIIQSDLKIKNNISTLSLTNEMTEFSGLLPYQITITNTDTSSIFSTVTSYVCCESF